jgi:hypothetical protein
MPGGENAVAKSAVTFNDDAYEISPSVLNEFDFWQGESQSSALSASTDSTPATYLLAAPVQCPACHASIRSVHVFGLIGAVATGDDDSERGLHVACPRCKSTIPAALAGL